jgi:hypothetical protein
MTETSQRDLSHNPILVIASWCLVGLPLAWGVVQTLYKAGLLFK